MRTSRKGFTLVEMLIVIVIIGLLATTIIPKIMNISVKARNTQRTADMRGISTALTMYRGMEGLVPMQSGAVSDIFDKLSPYLKSLPTDPNNNKLSGIIGSGITNCSSYLPAGQYGYVGLEGGQGFAILATMDNDTNINNYNRGYSGQPLTSGSIMHGCIDATMTRKQLREASCDITGFPGGENLFAANYNNPNTWGKGADLNFVLNFVQAPFGGLFAHKFAGLGNVGAGVSFKPLGNSVSEFSFQDTTQSVFVKPLVDLPSGQGHIGFAYRYGPGGVSTRVIRANLNYKSFVNGNVDETTGFMSLRSVGDGRFLLSVSANKTPGSIHIGKLGDEAGSPNYSEVALWNPHLQYGMTAPCGDTVKYMNGNTYSIQRRYIEVSD